jgi:uncharacterized protein YlzI (FlbEa/FlbD family)
MITLHRLGHTSEPFQLNPDLIVTVESTPDTIVTLATTAKVVVAESPEEVAAAVRAWRVDVLSEAMRNRRGGPGRDDGTHPRGGSVYDLHPHPGGVEGSHVPADERGQ